MKKTVFLFVILMSMLLAASPAMAASTTYSIDELYMTVDVADDLIVFTRDIDENDPNLASLGLTKSDLESVYLQNGIYLNALPPDASYEVVVIMYTDEGIMELYDINQYSDSEIEQMAETFFVSDENTGINYTDYTFYQHSQTKFIVADLWQSNNNQVVYGRQYYTIINGQSISVTLHSYSGEITDEMDRIQKGIVDSIVFTQGAASTTSGGTDILSGDEVSAGDDADDIKLGLIILGVIALLAILVIAGIIIAVVLIVRSNKKKRQMSAGYQTSANAYPVYHPEPAQKDVYCQSCGTRNSSGSAFCAQCGAKLNDRNSQAQ